MQPLILLHGALGTAGSLDLLHNALGAHAHIYVMEFSGHGDASWPEDAGFSIDTFETDVCRFMDARNIQAAHLFGYSMGGFVALRIALNAPDRVLSVTTLATKLNWTAETCAKEAAMLDAVVLEAKAPKFVAALAAAHPVSGWRKLVQQTQQMIGGMHKYRLDEQTLASMQQPIRLMVGDRDKMVSLDETIQAYRALPAASMAILPKTPHPLEGADAALLATLIQQHLAAVTT